MKSIIEEASSISKAIKNGWIKAGRPQEFSVKIFEEPEKGFLGLFTKKRAKIGIFFKEIAEAPAERVRKSPRQEFRTRHIQERQEGPSLGRPSQQQQRQPQQQARVVWNAEMIQAVRHWLDSNTHIIHGVALPFAVNANNNMLTIRFETRVVNDKRKEQLFFKNSAQLIMQALQHKFKKQAFGLKITLQGAN